MNVLTAQADTRNAAYQELKSRIHQELLNRLNLDRLTRVKREDAEPEIRGAHRRHAGARSREDAAQPVRARAASSATCCTSCSASGRSKALLRDPRSRTSW